MSKRGLKTVALILGTLGVITVLVLLYIFNPTETSVAPKCVFKAITGWSCSGCGMQRFIHAFLHGRFLEAIQYNYMLVVFLPYLLLFGIEQLVLSGETQKCWKRVIEGRTVTITMAVIVFGWVFVRNIFHI
jgi:hypothetical protein